MTKPRILIAEDLPENREALTLMLQMSGFACLTAADGLAARDTALREQPELLLLDLSLPLLDGLSVLAELRAAGFAAPILIISARDDVQSQRQARVLGANGFVSKPIEFAHLLAAIRAQLANE